MKDKDYSYVVSVDDDMGIEFSDGSVLFYVHEQDCCENHWANFSYTSMDDFDGLMFDTSSLYFIIPIPDYGFRMKSVCGQEVSVPCYGRNNGYYSTNLTLVLSKENIATGEKEQHILDISDCQEIRF